jgi:hypothetical protein
LGEVEDWSSRVGGDGGRPAASVKSAAAVARAREKEREKEREKRKKSAQVLSMN